MSIATDMRDAYLAAEKAILLGQAYTLGDRTLTRANLREVIAGRQEWERKALAEARGASGAYALANFTGHCGSEGSERCWSRNL